MDYLQTISWVQRDGQYDGYTVKGLETVDFIAAIKDEEEVEMDYSAVEDCIADLIGSNLDNPDEISD